MPTILFRFPGGRYHATPWGHHVNEGLVEWPPSPWRLLRAFIATAFTKLDAPDPLPEDHVLRRLVTAFSETLPSYRLPVCPATHTRHYMPLGDRDGKTTLVLDACAVPGTAPLVVEWPATLDAEGREYLGRVLAAMSYLGRAESWVESRLLPEGDTLPAECSALTECVPHIEGVAKGPGWEQAPLLATLRSADYAAWRESAVADALKDLSLPGGEKKPPKGLLDKRTKAVAFYPEDLFACLTCDTTFWQNHGWSQPPGSRQQLYWRRTNLLETAQPLATHRAKEPAPVEAMRLALASDTSQREVLPLFSRALPQAELLHRALVSRAPGSPVIRGTDADGRPLTGHQHLHILPLSLDEPGRLDHFLLWAPMGLDGAAQRAIMAVRRTWTKGGEKPLFVTVAGMGSLAALGQGKHSTTWVSVTPFVPTRFLKKGGANTLEGQIQAELASRGFPPARVAVMTRDEWVECKFHRFVLARRDAAKAPPQSCGFGVRLTFAEPVSGPLTLGYASHFGLGLFVAAAE